MPWPRRGEAHHALNSKTKAVMVYAQRREHRPWPVYNPGKACLGLAHCQSHCLQCVLPTLGYALYSKQLLAGITE